MECASKSRRTKMPQRPNPDASERLLSLFDEANQLTWPGPMFLLESRQRLCPRMGKRRACRDEESQKPHGLIAAQLAFFLRKSAAPLRGPFWRTDQLTWPWMANVNHKKNGQCQSLNESPAPRGDHPWCTGLSSQVWKPGILSIGVVVQNSKYDRGLARLPLQLFTCRQ